ncbi:hypothetical protein E2I00_006511, partial [Balaenoptera physalus]
SQLQNAEKRPHCRRLPACGRIASTSCGTRCRCSAVPSAYLLVNFGFPLVCQERPAETNANVDDSAPPSVAQLAGRFREQAAAAKEKSPPNAHHPPKVKVKSSPLIEKLQANLVFDPAALLPGASPKSPGLKAMVSPFHSPPSTPSSPGVRSRASEPEEVPVSFDQPPEGSHLPSYNKVRTRGSIKRRPPSRRFRRSQSEDCADLGELRAVESSQENGAKEENGDEEKPAEEQTPEPAEVKERAAGEEAEPGQRSRDTKGLEEGAVGDETPQNPPGGGEGDHSPEQGPGKEKHDEGTILEPGCDPGTGHAQPDASSEVPKTEVGGLACPPDPDRAGPAHPMSHALFLTSITNQLGVQ